MLRERQEEERVRDGEGGGDRMGVCFGRGKGNWVFMGVDDRGGDHRAAAVLRNFGHIV